MKKYLVLLIIPLFFFSIGCNDDDDNDDIIPVSEYPELILGSWKNETLITTTTTQSIEIDPIYGTETSETSSQTDYTPPYKFLFTPTSFYYTFKYDETLDFYGVMESDIEDKLGTLLFNGETNYSINQNQIIIGNLYIKEPENVYLGGALRIGDIQDFTNSSFTVNRTTIDTTEIVNNSYSIIEKSKEYFFERIEESDIPTSN